MADLAEAPPAGTDARRWWDAGAEAEARARDEYMNPAGREVRAYLEALAALAPKTSAAELAASTARVFCADQPRRWRLRLAWQIGARQ